MDNDLDFKTFKVRINLCKYEGPINKGNHRYTVFEDVLGYFCSKYNVKDDNVSLIVMKVNRIEPQKNLLTLSSFKKKIQNMDSYLTQNSKGLSRGSSQGNNVAKEIFNMIGTRNLSRDMLKSFVNEYYGEKIL